MKNAIPKREQNIAFGRISSRVAITEYCEYITRGTFLCMRRAIRESPTLEIVLDDSQGTRNVLKVSYRILLKVLDEIRVNSFPVSTRKIRFTTKFRIINFRKAVFEVPIWLI